MSLPSSIASLARQQAGVTDAAGNPLYRTGIRGIVDRVGISTLLFCAALVVWIFLKLLDQSYFNMYLMGVIHRIIRLICFVLLAGAEYLDWKQCGFSRRSIVALSFMCVLLISTIFIGSTTQVDAAAFIFCARNRSFAQIARALLVVMACTFLFIVICSFAGVIENTLVQASRERAYLGFRYALYSAACLLGITLLCLYLAPRRILLPTAALLCVAIVAVYLFTDSRLSAALALFAIVLVVVFNYWGQNVFSSRAAGAVFTSVFVLSAVVSIVLSVAYSPDNAFLESLNKTFGNRLEFGQRAMAEYGAPLFGQSVEFVGAGLSRWGTHKGGAYFYLDNIYLRLLVEYGLAVFIIHVVAYTFCIYKAWKAGNIAIVVALFVLALHGIVDNLMLYLWYNPFLLLWGMLFSDREFRLM